jgi:hypothetical protein
MALPNPILSQTEDGLLPLDIRIVEALKKARKYQKIDFDFSDISSYSSRSTGFARGTSAIPLQASRGRKLSGSQ